MVPEKSNLPAPRHIFCFDLSKLLSSQTENKQFLNLLSQSRLLTLQAEL